MTTIHDAILPDVGPDQGLLDLWTTEFLLTGVTSDNLFDRYRTLEGYFSTLLLYQAKGAILVIEAENAQAEADAQAAGKPDGGVLGPDQPPAVTSYLTTFKQYVDEEADRFEECVLRLVFAAPDFVGDYSGSRDFLPASAEQVLARAQFVLARIRGEEQSGMRGYLISTADAPPFSLFAPATSAPGGEYTPSTASATRQGPRYDFWSDATHVKVDDTYTVTHVDFGDLPSGAYSIWGQAPGYLLALADVTVTTYNGDYEPDPDGDITYGGFLIQARSGGSMRFEPAVWANDTLSEHVSKGDGKASATVVQAIDDLEVTTSGSVSPHGSYDHQTDPEISVVVEMSRSFFYAGTVEATGTLHYKILPTGKLHADRAKNNISTVYHYGVWNITDSKQVALATGGGDLFNDKFKEFDGKDVVGALDVKLEPGKEYKVYAKWIVKVPGGQTEDTSGYSFSTTSILDCKGAALTF